jgi:hypothetical protein
MKFKSIYIVFLLCFIPVLLQSQSGNPFEIKSRKSLPTKTVKKEKVKKETADTPRDTIKTIEQKDLQSNLQEEVQTGQIGLTSSNPEITDSLEPTFIPTGNNPFDISEERIGMIKPEASEVNRLQTPIKVEVDTKTNKHISFIFWVILFSLIVLAFPISIDRWYVVKIMRSLFNINISNTLAREFSGFNVLLFSLLYLVFIVSLSVFVFLFSSQYSGLNPTFNLYLMSLAGVFAIYFVRHIGLLVAKWIFPEVEAFNAFNFNILSFNVILGLSLIIPNLFLAFSPDDLADIFLYGGVGIILIFYGLRTARGLLISFKHLINQPIHYFIYLCTFEILPLLTLYKLTLGFN